MVIHGYSRYKQYSQDTLLTVPPYPFVLDDPMDIPLEKCWFARPPLYFTCYLRPRDGRSPCETRQEAVARMARTISKFIDVL